MMRTRVTALVVAGLWLVSSGVEAGSAGAGNASGRLAATWPRTQTGDPKQGVPSGVASLSAGTVTITTGATKSLGFFVGPGLVVAAAAPLGDRSVVSLQTSAGRSGLGQVVARDRRADLVVLRVHADLTPGVVFDAGDRPLGRLPAQAFLVRGDVAQGGPVEQVRLGDWHDVMGVRLVGMSPSPTASAVGAPCVDDAGRLVGVVVTARHLEKGEQLVLAAGRIGVLITEALRNPEAADAGGEAKDRRATPSPTPDQGIQAESDTEKARREGADAFERAADRLAREREDVIQLQARYDGECVGYVPIVAVPGVGWPYLAEYLVERRELPECKSLQEQVDGRVEALRRALAEAEERARRAGVYPGTVRDIKRANGLDVIR